ncbi:putative hlh transcription factor [Golovinomyces cichoracearum]|uniref:Putative hlh transcription factor n=1 Tax=Golovinomyces cichoracearum TaxID=62708 RepID=A0A420IBV4_9PEZI|nr:putative hlh transcription factor [Golovinomyces cichoracearum]
MASSVSTQKLPAGLVGVLNSDDQRDSAYFSTKDPDSKHNSTQSNGVYSIDRADTASITDVTPPSRLSSSRMLPLKSPKSGTMSVASMVSPTYQGFSQPLHEPGSHNSGISSNSTVSVFSTNDNARRESVDSRLGANFGEMRLANSPYVSANPSTTSLQSNLAQQRNPSSALQERKSVPYLISHTLLPKYPRLIDPDSMSTSRTAPLITGPAKEAIARASEPTKGQAWAFPEEPIHRNSSSACQSSESHAPLSNKLYGENRRDSYPESVSSIQYAAELLLPPGQRRLEDGMPSEYNQKDSSKFKVSTHHHSLQHRQITELQTENECSNNSQPYSRTPELRVSHKLAERKRRLEMKDLFDNLRTLQSVERGAKASKWEILSKAISEHERQTKLIEDQRKAISRLESQVQRMEIDLENSRRDSNITRAENARLRSEIASLQNSCTGQLYHSTSSHQQLIYNGSGSVAESQSQLPPLRSIQVPEVMNGVQYHHEERSDVYRANSERY